MTGTRQFSLFSGAMRLFSAWDGVAPGPPAAHAQCRSPSRRPRSVAPETDRANQAQSSGPAAPIVCDIEQSGVHALRTPWRDRSSMPPVHTASQRPGKCLGVYSKQNLYTWRLDVPLPGCSCGSLIFTRLHHAFSASPAKVGSSLYHSTINCLRLPGPLCHTSNGACGWNRLASRG